MKNYSLTINWKRLKRVSKTAVCVWLAAAIFTIFFVIQLVLPVYGKLEDLTTQEISIDAVYWLDSLSRFGGNGLEIVSGDQEFYFWYPNFTYRRFMHEVETELLNDIVTTATVTIVNQQSLQDRIRNRKEIVDFRSGDSVYYDLETAKKGMRSYKVDTALAFLMSLLVWAVTTMYIQALNKVVVFRKKKKPKKIGTKSV